MTWLRRFLLPSTKSGPIKGWEKIDRERQSALGITHAIWLYANAPCMKDPFHPTAADVKRDAAHREANGKKYRIDKGLLVDGKRTWPGKEEECKCISRSVIFDANGVPVIGK
jgi:hypothetical protein